MRLRFLRGLDVVLLARPRSLHTPATRIDHSLDILTDSKVLRAPLDQWVLGSLLRAGPTLREGRGRRLFSLLGRLSLRKEESAKHVHYRDSSFDSRENRVHALVQWSPVSSHLQFDRRVQTLSTFCTTSGLLLEQRQQGCQVTGGSSKRRSAFETQSRRRGLCWSLPSRLSVNAAGYGD